MHPFIHLPLSLSLALSFERARSLSMHVQAYSKEYRELLPAAHIAVWTPHSRWRRLVWFPAHNLLILRVARIPMRGGLHGCENAVCALSLSVRLFVWSILCARVRICIRII